MPPPQPAGRAALAALRGIVPAGKAPRHVAVYFSASWCPPCRAFTPVLAASYRALPDPAALEVVFVSLDEDPAADAAYGKTMPWPRVPHGDERCAELSEGLGPVESIPTLVVIDTESGEVVNRNAVGAVRADPDGCPWTSPKSRM